MSTAKLLNFAVDIVTSAPQDSPATRITQAKMRLTIVTCKSRCRGTYSAYAVAGNERSTSRSDETPRENWK